MFFTSVKLNTFLLLCLFVKYSVCDQGHNVTEVGSTIIHDGPVQLFFTPAEIRPILEGNTATVYVNFTIQNPADGPLELHVRCRDEWIAKVDGNSVFRLSSDDAADVTTTNGTLIRITGVFLGRTVLQFRVRPAGATTSDSNLYRYGNSSADDRSGLITDEEGWKELPVEYQVPVMRKQRILDKVFSGVVFVFVFIANGLMGCKIDLSVVKEVLKRPIAPAIGFFCQFLFMPSLSYGIIHLIGLTGGQALGFFAIGCSPGGGASNLYTYLLDGDLSLSVTMTFVSTVASLGMIPLWLFTLGKTFLVAGREVHIPYENILITLLGITIPVGIGLLIQKKKPEWAKKITRLLKPVFLIFIIFMFTIGIYVNIYIFKLFTARLVLCGALLPYCGFLLGGITSAILRQPLSRIKAIAIETGIQNAGVAILMMKFSMPPPDGDLAMVSPIVTITMTPIPLLISVVIYSLYKKFCKKQELDFEAVKTDEDTKETTDSEKEMKDLSDGMVQNSMNDKALLS